jgi:MFS family permease
MVPLFILYLGGNVVQVALLTTLYNAVLIPASIFWGRMTDRLARRRLFFVITSAGSTLIFSAMFLLPNLTDLAILYACLGLVVTANAVAANLLVMETSPKKTWITSYSRLYQVANIGSVLGLTVGFIWTGTLPITAFLVFCAGSTGAALVLCYSLITEPPLTLETSHLTINPASFPSRIYHGMTFFANHLVVSRVMVKDAVRLFQATRAGAITGRVLLFFSAFLFTTSSAFLNTSFSPFLVSSGVTDSEVFAISLFNIIVQTIVYRWMSGFIKRFGGVRVGPYAVLGRTFIYMVFAASALELHGLALFVLSSILYSLIGVAFALWNSSTSVTLLSSLGSARQGNVLGGYAALGALGTVAGSLFTGYTSFYEGYSTTFTIAAGLMLFSFFVLEAALKSMGYQEKEVGPASG